MLQFPLTTQQLRVLRSVQGPITEWRQTAGSAKSTMLLCALKLAVSGGIGLFLTKSREMAKDAYVLAQRLFGESGVLLLSVESPADGLWVNHAYEYFKEKARDPEHVEVQKLNAVDLCIRLVWERYQAGWHNLDWWYNDDARTSRALL